MRLPALAVLAVLLAGCSSNPAPAQKGGHLLVGLGDSVPAASGCDCVSYVQEYADGLAKRLNAPVPVRNLSRPGESSKGVLSNLEDGPLADAVTGADIVVLTIGANDFSDAGDRIAAGDCGGPDGLACADGSLDTLRQRMAAILGRIDQLRAGKPTMVAVTGYWAVFGDGAVAEGRYDDAVRARFAALTTKVNTVIATEARTTGAAYADLDAPFHKSDPTPLLAPDGDHPSQAGHDLIASLLLALPVPLVTAGNQSPAGARK